MAAFAAFFVFFPYYIFTSMTGLYIIDPLGRTVNGTFQDMSLRVCFMLERGHRSLDRDMLELGCD